jgi:hypothetical protein
MRKIFLIVMLIFVSSGLFGCGNSNLSLTGKVAFEDGQPLTKGMVIFDNGTVSSRAPINPDGTFVVGTAKEKDGIPLGTYKVCIVGAEEMLPNPERKMPPPKRQLIHKKFEQIDTSGLTITIANPTKPFNIIVIPPDEEKISQP